MVAVGQIYRVPLGRTVIAPGRKPYDHRIVKVIKVHDGLFDVQTLDDPPLHSRWTGKSSTEGWEMVEDIERQAALWEE